jgi:predicted alpha/beta superfamily hydrolase
MRKAAIGWLAVPILLAAVAFSRWSSAAPPRYQEQTLRSSVLAEDRRFLVRLPRHYELDADARYPVLYKLDGDNQLDRYDESIDVLHSASVMPDLIVVAIPNAPGQRNRDLTPPTLHQNSERGETGQGPMGAGDRFLEFIERELIPHVDKTLRTTPERIFAGHSRGALLVLHSLLVKPGLFDARLVFSAPLMRDEQRLVVETRKFLAEHPDHRSFLYLNWGERENETMEQSCRAMSELLKSGAPTGLRWAIERAHAADHQQTHGLALPSALFTLYSGSRASLPPARPGP